MPVSTDPMYPGASPLRPSQPLWKRLLIVDDNPADLRVAQQMLGAWSRRVDGAADGLKAVSIVAESLKSGSAFDAIVLDYYMPGMDGPATARMIRASGYRGPILAVSANPSEGTRSNSHKAGCAAFLPKPIPWTELITVLRALAQPSE